MSKKSLRGDGEVVDLNVNLKEVKTQYEESDLIHEGFVQGWTGRSSVVDSVK